MNGELPGWDSDEVQILFIFSPLFFILVSFIYIPTNVLYMCRRSRRRRKQMTRWSPPLALEAEERRPRRCVCVCVCVRARAHVCIVE
jgi:hypothetical protein